MYMRTSEGLGQTLMARNGDEHVKWSLGEPRPTPQTCDIRGIPERAAVRALTALSRHRRTRTARGRWAGLCRSWLEADADRANDLPAAECDPAQRPASRATLKNIEIMGSEWIFRRHSAR